MRSKGRELTSCPAPAERWRATAGARAEAEETVGADVWLGSFWKKKPSRLSNGAGAELLTPSDAVAGREGAARRRP